MNAKSLILALLLALITLLPAADPAGEVLGKWKWTMPANLGFTHYCLTRTAPGQFIIHTSFDAGTTWTVSLPVTAKIHGPDRPGLRRIILRPIEEQDDGSFYILEPDKKLSIMDLDGLIDHAAPVSP